MNFSKITYFLFFLIVFITCLSCNDPEPRKPVSVRSGSFLKESIKRNKEILALEEKVIQIIIKKDTLHTYHSSANGYWYYYNIQDTIENYHPKTDDIVEMTYNIRTLNNDTIYSFEEIGIRKLKIDKENYFPGFRTGIKLLKKGESATFLFPSSIAYGFYGDLNKIGTNEPLISTIKLLDIIEKSKDTLIN